LVPQVEQKIFFPVRGSEQFCTLPSAMVMEAAQYVGHEGRVSWESSWSQSARGLS
jgi:hypothetical protein